MIVVVFLLLVCGGIELFVLLYDVPQYLFPAPSAVARSFASSFEVIVANVSYTMAEAILGFLIGNTAAISFAVLFTNSRVAREAMLPVIIAMQAVPILAIAPFITIWFGPGMIGKAILAAMICYFPATVIATRGFLSVDSSAFELLKTMGANRWQIFKYASFPSSLPHVLTAFELSATLCAIGAVVAELSGASRGAGYLIIEASYQFRTADLFAVLVGLAIATVSWYYLIRFAGRTYARKYSVKSIRLS